MFRSTIVTLSILVLLAATGLIVHMSDVEQTDRDEYQKLVESSSPEVTAEASQTYVSKQRRINVEKNIWFTEETQRLQFRLTSKESELIFTHSDQQTEVVEQLYDAHFYMQEELYYILPDAREATIQPNGRLLIRYADASQAESWVDLDLPNLRPMQRLRYLEADVITYDYKSSLFVANHATLLRYTTEGHQLPKELDDSNLIMAGKAESIEFSLARRELKFRAHHLKATFYSRGGLM